MGGIHEPLFVEVLRHAFFIVIDICSSYLCFPVASYVVSGNGVVFVYIGSEVLLIVRCIQITRLVSPENK